MRYHFNLRDGRDWPDETGTELPSIDTARGHAVRYLGEVLAQSPATLWQDGELGVQVTDTHGLILFDVSVTVRDAPALEIRAVR